VSEFVAGKFSPLAVYPQIRYVLWISINASSPECFVLRSFSALWRKRSIGSQFSSRLFAILHPSESECIAETLSVTANHYVTPNIGRVLAQW